MSLKTILINLNDAKRATDLTSAALGLAAQHEAHVIGLYVKPAMQIYPAVGMQVSPEMYEVHDKYFQDASASAERKFEAALKQTGVSGEWRSISAAGAVIADKIVEHGRQCDLLVLGQVNPDNTGGIEMDCAERVVVEAGRPVLLLPLAGSFKTIGKNIVVGWNATREAARAVFDALPFIMAADTTRVVWIDANGNEDYAEYVPGAELAASLSRHGATVTVDAMPSGGVSVGDVLLNSTANHSADLLVMGAYGHSRLREFIFGGATRGVLQHMTLPVLMSQ